MFLENNKTQKLGWVEVICGSMFSGKTEELIRRLNRAEFARQSIEIYKPNIDTRFHALKLVSHKGHEVFAQPVSNSEDLLTISKSPQVIGIDEAQFFDLALPSVCNTLANRGVRVIVAGLDMDFKGKPFGPMPEMMATAEYVTKVHAICLNCGSLAYLSRRKSDNDNLVLLGQTENYEPLCRSCFNLTLKSHVQS
jgi:thymidine kinase